MPWKPNSGFACGGKVLRRPRRVKRQWGRKGDDTRIDVLILQSVTFLPPRRCFQERETARLSFLPPLFPPVPSNGRPDWTPWQFSFLPREERKEVWPRVVFDPVDVRRHHESNEGKTQPSLAILHSPTSSSKGQGVQPAANSERKGWLGNRDPGGL